MLADASQRSLKTETRVFDQASQQADGEVKRIIAANLGRSVKAPACRPPASTPKPSPAHRAAGPGSVRAPASPPVVARAALIRSGRHRWPRRAHPRRARVRGRRRVPRTRR
jgi:hypothetical protein